MLTSFCGILTLQVGTSILAATFFTIAVLVLFENTFNYENDPSNGWPIPLVLVIIFVIFITLAAIMMFMAAYNESRGQCILSVILLVLAMAYWITLSCLSFANNVNHIRTVCVMDRCAESFWLINLEYRGNWRGIQREGEPENVTKVEVTGNNTEQTAVDVKEDEAKICESPEPGYQHDMRRRDLEDSALSKYTNKEHANSNTTFDLSLYIIRDALNELNSAKHTIEHTIAKRDDSSDDGTSDDDSDENDEKAEGDHSRDGETKYDFGLAMVGAITLFVLNFVYFLFSILIMWSFAQELKWTDYYDEEEN